MTVPLMKVYCEHGGLNRKIREMERRGFIELVHFPYDPNSRTAKLSNLATPSQAQVKDLNVPIGELPGSFKDYSGSAHLGEIVSIIGANHRRDALHVDSAYKSGCSAFVTRDSDILKHRRALEEVLQMCFFHPDDDCDELLHFVSLSLS